MTYAHHHRGIFSFIMYPLLVAVIAFGIFSIVWLRSNVRSIEYGIASLDNQKREMLKEKKMLMAEKASILSLQSIKSRDHAKLGLIFPDRVKVVYVKRDTAYGPYKISLEGRKMAEP